MLSINIFVWICICLIVCFVVFVVVFFLLFFLLNLFTCICLYSHWWQANERYSKQLSLPEHFSCILDEDGGLLLAAKAVKAFQVNQFSNKTNKQTNKKHACFVFEMLANFCGGRRGTSG